MFVGETWLCLEPLLREVESIFVCVQWNTDNSTVVHARRQSVEIRANFVLQLRFTETVFVLLETCQSRSAIPPQLVFTCPRFSAIQDYVTNLLRSDPRCGLS